MKEPWRQDDVVIALPGYVWRTRWEVGKPYIINKYLDDQGDLVGIYCDICRPVEKVSDGLAFDDLYLDVWQIPGSDQFLPVCNKKRAQGGMPRALVLVEKRRV